MRVTLSLMYVLTFFLVFNAMVNEVKCSRNVKHAGLCYFAALNKLTQPTRFISNKNKRYNILLDKNKSYASQTINLITESKLIFMIYLTVFYDISYLFI